MIKTYPCPTCKKENMLTYIDVEKGHQCDNCTNDELENVINTIMVPVTMKKVVNAYL